MGLSAGVGSSQGRLQGGVRSQALGWLNAPFRKISRQNDTFLVIHFATRQDMLDS